MYWLSSKKRKRHQRAINQLIRKINKNFCNEEWSKHYKLRQVASEFHIYEDKSGAELFVHLRFTDDETGYVRDFCESVNTLRFANKIYWEINECIIHAIEEELKYARR